MAARKQLFHPDEVRQKIQTSQLINRLQSNALGEIEPELSNGQIKSIEILIKKVVPDVQSVAMEVTGKDGGPIQTEDVSDKELARRVALLLVREGSK